MVYQFCRGLDEKFNVDYSKNYIDLAALGICGDMMSGLEIENQYFWRKGFTNINNFFLYVNSTKTMLFNYWKNDII